MSKKILLNQVVALVTGKKTQYQKAMAKEFGVVKQDAVDGLIRSYAPFNDEDKNIPTNDSKGIAVDLRTIIRNFGDQFSEMVDLIATNDVGNQTAIANVMVACPSGDDVCVLKDVPVTHLLYLEKALSEMRNFIANLPVLNSMYKWTFDDNRDCFVTVPIQSTRTSKRKYKFVKAEATDKHPAQVDVYDEDVPVGIWNTTYISTALDGTTKKEYLRRIDALIDGVKKAREIANGREVEMIHYGGEIVDFIFAKVK